MKDGFFVLTMIVALTGSGNFAIALDASLASTQSGQTLASASNPQTSETPRNVAATDFCRQVDVAVDEGYGVSSHETRYECTTPNP